VSSVVPEPASFRDPRARVFYHHGAVYRALSGEASRDWALFRESRLFGEATLKGALVATEEADPHAVPTPLGRWKTVLAHDAVPFVSYPYEWTFGMARAAALLQLDLLSAALDEGLVLRDGSAFNVQWVGSRPMFIDVTSFGRLRPGDAWAGYRQFCSQCLNPLLLHAYKGVPFGPWLRGDMEGIEPDALASLCSVLDLLRSGVFAHVYLHARLQARYQGSDRSVRDAVRDGRLGTGAIRSTVRSLRRVIAGLRPPPSRSAWTDYGAAPGYAPADHAKKRAFVEHVLKARRRALVWDLGCNTGEYARLAADHSTYVIAIDRDHDCVDALFHACAQEKRLNLLPLVTNVVNPSPNQGWRQRERTTLASRGRPELVLGLALLHHLAIGANVPIAEIVELLSELGDEVVVEFVDRRDPMAQRLLRNREDDVYDYSRECFEAHLAQAFRVERREELAGGLRVLYHGTRQ
jgi:SAM-dependent methyltransferase